MKMRPPVFNVQQIYTIRFEKVFPDFETWKECLLARGMKEEDIEEGIYDFLFYAIGTMFLKWRDARQAATYASGMFKMFYAKYKQQYALFNVSIDELQTTKTQYGQNEPALDANDNSYNTTNVKHTMPIGANFGNVAMKVSMDDPMRNLLDTFISSIVLLVQPNDLYEYPRGGDYGA